LEIARALKQHPRIALRMGIHSGSVNEVIDVNQRQNIAGAGINMAHFKNAASTALEMGHTDARVTIRHYRELVRPKDAERYWQLQPARTQKIVPLVAR
jgi:hypothetical protein